MSVDIIQKSLWCIIVGALVIPDVASSQALRSPFESFSPQMHATGVARTAEIKTAFTTPMLSSSMNSSTIFLYGERSGRQTGKLAYDESNRILTVSPDRAFIYGEQLQWILTDSVGTAAPYQPVTGGFSYKFVAGVLQGSGMFSPPLQPAVQTGSPFAVTASDFNGDGYTDCAVTNKNSASIAVLLNTKRNGFYPPVSYSVGASPEAIAVADLTRDGAPDIIVANRLGNSITLLSNNGGGTFSSHHYAVGKEPIGIAVADCNNDGWLDLAIVTAADSMLRVYQFAGDSVVARQSIPCYGIPSAIVLDDLNNDGYTDCAVTTRSNNKLLLFRNDSSGILSYDTLYSVGSTPVALIAYDAVLGSDGFADLATVNAGSHNLSIVKNDKTGRFQGPEHFAIGGSNPSAICGNDFDGDGDLDLAITNTGSKSIVMFRNNGFALPDTLSIPLSSVPHGIAALDVTGTYGIMDLVVSSMDAGTVSIVRNSFVSPPPPELSVLIDSVRFEPTRLHDTSRVLIPVYSSLTPATIDSITITSKNFSVQNSLPLTLLSYDSSVLGIQYTPSSYGVHHDTIKIFSTGGTRSIPVRGTSLLPQLTTNHTAVSYGSVKEFDTAVVLLTFTNTSVNTVTIDSARSQTTRFVLGSLKLPVSLRNGDSVTMNMRFIPRTVGLFVDTLSLYTTPLSSTLRIPLQGKGEPSVGVEPAMSATQPSVFMLDQNYPNPFNPVTTISFALPTDANVSIVIYDALGRIVSHLVNNEYRTGYYSVTWDAQHFSSGVYYYRMQAQSLHSPSTVVGTRKLIVIK